MIDVNHHVIEIISRERLYASRQKRRRDAHGTCPYPNGPGFVGHGPLFAPAPSQTLVVVGVFSARGMEHLASSRVDPLTIPSRAWGLQRFSRRCFESDVDQSKKPFDLKEYFKKKKQGIIPDSSYKKLYHYLIS